VEEDFADLARPQVTEPLPDQTSVVLVPGAVEKDGVAVRIQSQVGGCALPDRNGACLRADVAFLLRAPRVEALHRLFEDARE
jgi:hypothetical protein